MLPDAVKSCQILSNFVKSCQILSNFAISCQIMSNPANLVKSCQINSNSVKSSKIIYFSDWNSDRKSSKNSTVIGFSDGNSCFFSDEVKILGYLDPEQKNEAQNLCLRCSLRQCPNLTCEKLSYECLFASRFCQNLN